MAMTETASLRKYAQHLQARILAGPEGAADLLAADDEAARERVTALLAEAQRAADAQVAAAREHATRITADARHRWEQITASAQEHAARTGQEAERIRREAAEYAAAARREAGTMDEAPGLLPGGALPLAAALAETLARLLTAARGQETGTSAPAGGGG